MASLSYPKSVRLHYRKDFQALLDSASTHYNAVFKVFWLVRECPEGVNGCVAEGCDCADVDVACAAEAVAPETGVCGDVSRVSGDVAPETGVNPAGCRFAVSVPKKSFKRAVKRNLLKRRTREAIRLNRQHLPEGFCADFLFFYRVGEVLDYADIEKAVVEAFTAVPAKAAAKAASAAGNAEANTPDTSAKTNTPDASAEANLVDSNAVENSSKRAENAQLDNSENTSGDE
jgi:ribonuclease P protein component